MKRKDPLVPGNIYHLYNRGVAKCPIVQEEADRWRFLQGLVLFNDTKSATNILWQLEKTRGRLTMNVLKEYVTDEAHERVPLVRILAYCLMDNHYHLLVEEITEGGISTFMHKLGLGYAKFFNNKYERVGSLFQDKFKNVHVSTDQYLQYVLVYINVLNPIQRIEGDWKELGIKDVERGLEYAETYVWGSHPDYLGLRGSLILDKGIFSELFETPSAYLEMVRSVIEEKRYEEIPELLFDD